MGRRILVVDDDGLVLKSVSRVLSRAGYSVLTAVDVESAMRHAQDGSIDAAVVDYNLSRDTGLTVLSRLRQVQPRCVRVLITGMKDSRVFVEAVNRGEVAKAIRKPFKPRDLLDQLDEAFASAKRLEQVTHEFNAEQARAERLALDQVIKPSALGMALQPIVHTGGVEPKNVAWEALIRPRHAMLSNPNLLLSAAERQDRVVDIGCLVLRIARDWLDRMPLNQLLFVNLHPQQLAHPDLLRRELAVFEGQAHRVTMEITERSALQEISRWEESVDVISGMGFALAVDDLGAGYSSLSILADLQPQYIKLDMSLVRGIDHEPRKRRLVQLMLQFAEATDAQVIAEGVETPEEASALTECGITLMQGYHYARPSESPDLGPI